METRVIKAPRLRRVLRVLSDGGWHSTRDIVRLAGVCAVNSAVSELRQKGCSIDCRYATGGGRRWVYRLAIEQLPSGARDPARKLPDMRGPVGGVPLRQGRSSFNPVNPV